MRPHFCLFCLLAAGVLSPAEDQKPAPPKASPAPAETDSRMESSSRRNENIQVNRIDNDAIKESNVRLGTSVTLISEPAVSTGYYAAEHGRPPAPGMFLPTPSLLKEWHGEVFEWHQNSVFNARTFFQVGDVKPSNRNNYGARFTGPLGGSANFTANVSQRKIRGAVNGNVLAPLPSERLAPLATDPAVRAIVERFFAAFPSGPPNRPDFDPRALNTNAPQRIDETDANLRLDHPAGANDKVSAGYTLSRARVDAFQLVAGQNPDTDIHSHAARLSWRHAFPAGGELVTGAMFSRVKSVLLPEPNAFGARVRFGFQIQELGPDSMFPINRAQNSYRYGGLFTSVRDGGRHILTAGGDLTRYQLNGIESNNQRGFFQFTNNFGRLALENVRWGTPSSYEVTIGELARGFRNWTVNAFVADQWKVSSNLQIYYGLRYNAETAPVEVDGLDEIPYGCDCNNFSPRLSIAWRAKGGLVVRTSYTVSFGQILPVTYQQVRNNPPLVHYITVQNPDLLNPLRGIDLTSPNIRYSPTVLSSDLVSPYSHQYNLSLERRLADAWLLRLGYVGSRTFKLLNNYQVNRAVAVPGIPITLATIDQRRADPRYYDVKNVVSAGIAYLDAARVSLEMPRRRGFTGEVSYTFGKAIDQGADYTSTSANQDMNSGRSQSQVNALQDKKGLSNFDSTHALMVNYSWEVPRWTSARGWLGWMASGWQVSGATLLKSGTPLTLYIGSDAPGIGNVDGGPSERPNILDPSILGRTISDPDTAPLILRRDRFAYITLGDDRGNLGRGTFRKSPMANFNASFSKQWRWGGSRERTVVVRGEAYNLTNHPQFDEPQRNLTAPPFGKLTNTLNNGRVFQFGFRLIL